MHLVYQVLGFHYGISNSHYDRTGCPNDFLWIATLELIAVDVVLKF